MMVVALNSPLIQDRLRPNEALLWHNVKNYDNEEIQLKALMPPWLGKAIYNIMMLLNALIFLRGLRDIFAKDGWSALTAYGLSLAIFLGVFIIIRSAYRNWTQASETRVLESKRPNNTMITDQRIHLFGSDVERSFERDNIQNAELDWDNGARSVRITEAGTGTSVIVARTDAAKVLGIVKAKLLT